MSSHTPTPPLKGATAATSKAPPAVASTGPLRVDSDTLMGGQRVLEIMHLGEVYRLQTTRFGKLILTK